MALCDKKIIANIEVNCDSLPVQGIEQRAIIINRDEIDWTATKAKKTGNVYTGIVMQTGKQGYEVQQYGKKPFNGSNSAAEVGDNDNRWNKTVNFIIMNGGVDAAKQVDALANGKFVMVVENTYRGANDDGAFEIIGIEAGLQLAEGGKDKYDDGTNSGTSISLVEMKAPTFEYFLFDTDYTTSQTAFNALLTPAV